MHYMSNQPHSHLQEEAEGPGLFEDRESPIARDFRSRAFTVGIGGPVGSGKTALLLALCRHLRDQYSLAVVTNDIYTKEDAEFLCRSGALESARIMGVETGGCPHSAIREDAWSATPGLDIRSMQHERLYSRLYRS